MNTSTEDTYHTLFNLIDVGLIIQDAETGQVLEVNDRICEMHGSSRDQIVGSHLKDLMDVAPPYSAVEALENIRKLHQEGPQTFEWLARAADGHFFWIKVSLKLAVLEGQTRIVAMVRDIDRRKRLALSLNEAESRMSALLEALPDNLFVVDQDGRILECIPSSLEQLYAPLDEIIEKRISDILPKDVANVIMAALGEADQQGGHRGTTYALDLAQGRSWFSLSIAALPENPGDTKRFVALAHDITELKSAHEHIEYLAYRDPLTGLANRNLALVRLNQALTQALQDRRPLAVLALNLNGFRLINNGYGHAAGDQLLLAISQRLKRQLTVEDTLCRLSADEFLIIRTALKRDHPPAQVADFAERLLDSLSLPVEIGPRSVSTSVSIGITLYPQDGDDAEQLMRQAQMTMGQAKKRGNDGFAFFEPQMHAELMRFNQTRDAMRAGLDHNEFELHYQPQIHLPTGRVLSVEALIRWRHPQQGLMQPAEFIAAAEDSGLIVPIGDWVLREACRQAASWHAAGWSNLTMAVNLSAKQFLRGSIGVAIETALAETRCEPHWLELEITESTLLHEIEALPAIMANWKRLGIQVSIDDFGTGYSSLSYLKKIRVDKLKIDRSFVAELLTDESDKAIVDAIIKMARALGLRVIAEGVENAETAEMLLNLGCDEAQGFYYAKPMPAYDLESWLATRVH